MSSATFVSPRKTFRQTVRIRVRAALRTYVRDTRDWVQSPAVFFLTSYVSLVFAIPFAWSLLGHEPRFWGNFYNVLAAGWTALFLSTMTLVQVKSIKGVLGAPVIGAFLIGASAFLYQDARNITVSVLNRHFPFAVSQLTEAVDAGSRFTFAIEVAGWATVLILAWYGLFMIQSFTSGRRHRRTGHWSFVIGSAGAVASLLVIGPLSLAATSSFGYDVLLVRSAYEWDFSQAFQCDDVPKGARVLLSKMSDNIGYAVNLEFPSAHFFA